MITYKVVRKQNPINKATKYYAQLLIGAPITIEQLAKRISESCTVNPADVSAVLIALEAQMIHALQEGKSVRFGNIGSFHITLNALGSETEQDFTSNNIKGIRCRFVPSTKLRKSLQPRLNSEINLVKVGKSPASQPQSPESDGSHSEVL